MQLPAAWMLASLLLAAGTQPAATAPASAPAGLLRDNGRLYAPITEASGLVRSRTAPDLFWTHNDSFNPSILYVIDRTGRCFAEFEVNAQNTDWEALAIDDRGNLYIGDIGNNEVLGHRLAMRRVFRLREPDLGRIIDRSVGKPVRRTLEVEAAWSYTFPAKPFDAEALFVRKGNLYLVSKVRGEPTHLYQVDTGQPGATRPLKEVCAVPQVHTVTDASLSDDGRRLAICSYTYVAIFNLDPQEPIENLARKQPEIFRFRPTSSEGCSWNGPEELILVAEGGAIYSLRVPVPTTQPTRAAR